MKVLLGLLIIIALFLSPNSNYGQDKINFIDLSIGLAQKAGTFRSNDLNYRFLVDFSYVRQLKTNQPLFWGLNSYYFTLGNTKGTYEELLDFGFTDFSYSTTSNVWGNHGFLRFYPDIYLGNVEIFIEAHLGFKYLFTVTSRSLEGGSDVSEYISESHSLSLTYGALGGLQYPIKNNLYLKAALGYFPGISASYYTKNLNLSIDNATIEGFDFSKSPTDIFRYSIGITYRY